MLKPYHTPVMVEEILGFMKVRQGGRYVDCTLGDGGHSEAILKQGGTVIGIDRDDEAIEFASRRLLAFGERFTAHRARFSNLAEVVDIDVGRIDGVVMDLGVSSRMLDDSTKGFSFMRNGPLSMNMGLSESSAFEVINRKGADELSGIFRRYGEERHARRIAGAIVEARSSHPIETTGELADIVERVVGGAAPQKSKARIFQAVRMYVNEEIEELQAGLAGAVQVMRQCGRMCVLSYHSLEDRETKHFMKNLANPCICPPDLPVCKCGRVPELKIITKRAVKPSEREMSENPRAKSARLRVAEKYTEAQ